MVSASFSTPRINEQQLKDEVRAMPEDFQEEATRDVLGHSSPIEETPRLVEEALENLQVELLKIPECNKQDFLQAEMRCPEYVNSQEFRLMFLRSTANFDASVAAQKIVRFWKRKVEIFGSDRAFRKLSIHDLLQDGDDRYALLQGGVRALPGRDEAGRGILMSFKRYWGDHLSMVRLLWFVVHELLQDVSVQCNGIVVLVANGIPVSRLLEDNNGKLDRTAYREVQHILPVRVQAVHIAITSQLQTKFLVQPTMFMLEPRLRARLVLHQCDSTNAPSEVALSLEDYGLTPDILPVELGGTLDFNYEEWVQEIMPTAHQEE